MRRSLSEKHAACPRRVNTGGRLAARARSPLRGRYEPRRWLRAGRAARGDDARATHAKAERALVQAEDAGGLALVAVGELQRLLQDLTLEVAQGRAARERVGDRRRRGALLDVPREGQLGRTDLASL